MTLDPIRFLLKHLTQKVYNDSISADSTPTSGIDEQLEIKISNAIDSGPTSRLNAGFLPLVERLETRKTQLFSLEGQVCSNFSGQI